MIKRQLPCAFHGNGANQDGARPSLSYTLFQNHKEYKTRRLGLSLEALALAQGERVFAREALKFELSWWLAPKALWVCSRLGIQQPLEAHAWQRGCWRVACALEISKGWKPNYLQKWHHKFHNHPDDSMCLHKIKSTCMFAFFTFILKQKTCSLNCPSVVSPTSGHLAVLQGMAKPQPAPRVDAASVLGHSSATKTACINFWQLAAHRKEKRGLEQETSHSSAFPGQFLPITQEQAAGSPPSVDAKKMSRGTLAQLWVSFVELLVLRDSAKLTPPREQRSRAHKETKCACTCKPLLFKGIIAGKKGWLTSAGTGTPAGRLSRCDCATKLASSVKDEAKSCARSPSETLSALQPFSKMYVYKNKRIDYRYRMIYTICRCVCVCCNQYVKVVYVCIYCSRKFSHPSKDPTWPGGLCRLLAWQTKQVLEATSIETPGHGPLNIWLQSTLSWKSTGV